MTSNSQFLLSISPTQSVISPSRSNYRLSRLSIYSGFSLPKLESDQDKENISKRDTVTAKSYISKRNSKQTQQNQSSTSSRIRERYGIAQRPFIKSTPASLEALSETLLEFGINDSPSCKNQNRNHSSYQTRVNIKKSAIEKRKIKQEKDKYFRDKNNFPNEVNQSLMEMFDLLRIRNEELTSYRREVVPKPPEVTKPKSATLTKRRATISAGGRRMTRSFDKKSFKGAARLVMNVNAFNKIGEIPVSSGNRSADPNRRRSTIKPLANRAELDPNLVKFRSISSNGEGRRAPYMRRASMMPTIKMNDQ